MKFSNDGSFLEQFKKLKEQPKNEQVAPPVAEPMPSPSQQNDWYKAALERAKQIAHTMTAPMEPKKDPDVSKIKDEPKPEPKGASIISPILTFFSLFFVKMNCVLYSNSTKSMCFNDYLKYLCAIFVKMNLSMFKHHKTASFSRYFSKYF